MTEALPYFRPSTDGYRVSKHDGDLYTERWVTLKDKRLRVVINTAEVKQLETLQHVEHGHPKFYLTYDRVSSQEGLGWEFLAQAVGKRPRPGADITLAIADTGERLRYMATTFYGGGAAAAFLVDTPCPGIYVGDLIHNVETMRSQTFGWFSFDHFSKI